jgi:hypothetical protein
VSGEFWWSGYPSRITVPTEIFPEMTCGVPAARAFGALAKRADNRSGLVDSTFEQIAQDAGMSRRQAAEGVAKLIELGLIEQVRKGNSRISSRYRLPRTPLADSAETRTVDDADSRTVKDAETRTVDPAEQCGNPHFVVRKSALPLVSSLGTTKDSSAFGGADADEDHTDADSIPGLLVVAPEPKAKRSRHAYTAEFEAWWALYPTRRGAKAGKYAASQQWTKATELASVEDLMVAVKAYATTCGDFPKDAERWLKGRMWEDHAEAASRAQSGDLTDAEITDILGPDLEPLPSLPPGVQPGTPEADAQRARDRAERRAARLAKALARMNRRSAS